MKSGLITPNGEFVDIPYYEIGKYAKKICNEYTEESIEKKQEFEQFKKNYTCFEPYYDFLIFKLNYKVENPFLQENTTGYTIGHFFITKDNTSKKIEKYRSVSDLDLKLTNYLDTTVQEGFIDTFGNAFKLDRTLGIDHAKTCQLILNQLMINSKEIYEDYLRCMSDPKIKEILTINEFYLIKRLGYIQLCIYETGMGNIIYNGEMKPAWFNQFKDKFQKQYPYIDFLEFNHEMNLENSDIESLKRRIV